jgi:copper(I)-binding protein
VTRGGRRSTRPALARAALTAAALAAIVVLAGACSRAPDTTVVVRDARIRAVVPGQDKTAGYLTIENRGGAPYVLTAVESARAAAIEIHTIVRDGDTVRMRRLPELAVEPGATVRLEPGGLHLMIFGITDSAEPFAATLVAGDGTRIEVPFALIALGGN